MSPLSHSKSPCFIWLPLWSLGKRRKFILTSNVSAAQTYVFATLHSASNFFLAHLTNLVYMQGSPADLLEWIFQSSRQIRGMSSDHFHFQMVVHSKWFHFECWAVDALFRSPSLLQLFFEMDGKGRILLSQWRCLKGKCLHPSVQASVLESHYNQHEKSVERRDCSTVVRIGEVTPRIPSAVLGFTI